MKFSVLSSGSKQNCFYVETAETAFLIDMGLSFKLLNQFLKDIGSSISRVEALFITHEHNDHISGLKSFVKNTRVPVFIHEKSRFFLDYPIPVSENLMDDKPVKIGDVEIVPVKVNHDAANTYGFRISNGRRNLFIASDIGSFDRNLLSICREMNAIAIESNYDEILLRSSYYPHYLKKRIESSNGHFSNRQAESFLEHAITEQTQHVFFLHLSENNNSYDTVKGMIAQNLLKKYPKISFHISHRDKPLSLVEI